jgi:hypothetical protein
MPLTTSITPTSIAVNVGQEAPADGSTLDLQWNMWIDDALMLIQTRADGLDISDIPQAKLDYVIREAVTDHVKHPDDATQVTISVDDGSTSKTYRSGAGRVRITDDWWTMLGLNPRKGKAFEVDTMPADAGVTQDPESLWYLPGERWAL